MRTATDGGAGQESRRRRATGRRTLIRVAVPGAAVALGAALLMGGGQGSALAVNVVDNPTFDAGVQGWKVNPGADLRLVAGRHGNGVRMTQPGPGNRTIALNDAVNTVASTVPRTSYDVGAWVRTTRPNAYVALRVMEVAPGALRGQGLTPLTTVGVRVSMTNAEGPGEWSQVVTILVL